MFDYRISKHPHFNEACRAFALRHNMAKLAERAGMNVQTLRNKLNPEQPHQLTAPDIWLLTDLTEDSTLVDGVLEQIHCLRCVPINEVAQEKMPQYELKATAEIGRVAANAVSGVQLNATTRRQVVESVNSVTRLMALTAILVKAPRSATSPNTSARTSKGVGWQKRSAKKPANHFVTVPSTSVLGHLCTGFNNSISSVFPGVRHTANSVC